MTITAQDVYSTLRPRLGCPPLGAHDIDRVVRVLNAHCASTGTVRIPIDVELSNDGQDAAGAHPPLLRGAEYCMDGSANGGTPT